MLNARTGVQMTEQTSPAPQAVPGSPSTPGGLLSTAARVGHHVWIERRLFEWLGSWTSVPAPSRFVVFAGESSARHGWHAEILFGRLPELREVDAEQLVTPPDDRTRAAVDALFETPDEERLLEALVGHTRVLLPSLVTSYRSLLAGASEVSDAALRRWLGFVLADDLEEWADATELLLPMLAGDGAADRAWRRQQELETLTLGCSTFPG
jgi:hypothetical protein